MKRVYHPTLDSWQDVPEGRADEWKAAGWLLKRPAHVTSDGPAGLAPPPPLVDNTPTALADVQMQDNTPVHVPESAKPIN